MCGLFTRASGIGWAVVLIAFYTDFFYNVVIAWCLHFFVASFTTDLPWTSCSNDWNTELCYDGDKDANSTNITQFSNTTASVVSVAGSTGDVAYALASNNITSPVMAPNGTALRRSPALEYFE